MKFISNTFRIKYILVILLLFGSFLANGQDEHLQFENISEKNGLPHFSINHILEDHLGFLWFATNSGLFRYDGYNLKEYLHDVHDSTSVSSPDVQFIAEDQSGRIWVSTMYGINLLDRRTGTFQRFLPYPSEINSKGRNFIHELLVDESNRLFALGNKKLFLFDEETVSFKMISRVDQPTIQYNKASIIKTENGTIWAAAGTGILKIEQGDTLFSFIQPDVDLASGYNKNISTIAPAGNNKIWIYTSSGLALFDPISQSLQKDILPSNFQSQSIQKIYKVNDGLSLIHI